MFTKKNILIKLNINANITSTTYIQYHFTASRITNRVHGKQEHDFLLSGGSDGRKRVQRGPEGNTSVR